jgi:hypothetical protein
LWFISYPASPPSRTTTGPSLQSKETPLPNLCPYHAVARRQLFDGVQLHVVSVARYHLTSTPTNPSTKLPNLCPSSLTQTQGLKTPRACSPPCSNDPPLRLGGDTTVSPHNFVALELDHLGQIQQLYFPCCDLIVHVCPGSNNQAHSIRLRTTIFVKEPKTF